MMVVVSVQVREPRVQLIFGLVREICDHQINHVY